MIQTVIEWGVFPILFIGIILFIEAGRRLRNLHPVAEAETGGKGLEVVEGAVFGLMALMIAFTFSGAATRFDWRRQLVTEEANCLGTAYLRIDYLPESYQPSIREKFRQYTDSRLEMYQVLPDVEAAKSAFSRSNELQGEIWKEARAAVQADPDMRSALLFIPALNEMFDIGTTRYMAAQFHTPTVILFLLVVLTWFCALLAGYRLGGEAQRKWIHMVIFAALMSLTIYVIIDYEYPRIGLIHLEQHDEILRAARASMQ
jgi:hypothetical protein